VGVCDALGMVAEAWVVGLSAVWVRACIRTWDWGWRRSQDGIWVGWQTTRSELKWQIVGVQSGCYVVGLLAMTGGSVLVRSLGVARK
jgi:hypothetical protein